MATRSKKSASKESSSHVSEKSTPISFKKNSSNRAPSPTMRARLQEKADLCDLNDRLAIYIDRNRALESENKKLTFRLNQHEETFIKDNTQIKSLYEKELIDARKLLDELATQKAKVDIENGKSKANANEYKKKYEHTLKELKTMEATLVQSESQCAAIQAKLTDALNVVKSKENQLNRLRKDHDDILKSLDISKNQLENETIERVDLQNKLQSMKEQVAFQETIHEQQMNETRTRSEISINQTADSIRGDFESKTGETLKQLREENEMALKSCREDTIAKYEERLQTLQAEINRYETEGDRSKDDGLLTRRELNESLAIQTSLRTEKASLETRVSQLENDLRRMRENYDQKLNDKNKELSGYRAKVSQMLEEYDELLGTKVALDAEISAYRKMLESEETRCKLSTSFSDTNNRKRKRIDEDTLDYYKDAVSASDYRTIANAKGPIQITETDYAGNYVKLYNDSDQDILLGGWQLSNIAGNHPITNYKFHRNLHIKAKSDITVWSANAGEPHSPPENLVMKGQRWFTANEMCTTLKNSTNEEVATLDMKRRIASSSRSQSSHDSGFSKTTDNKNCQIM